MKLKEVLPDLTSSQQTAYAKSRHIGESGRSISDIIEITKIRKIGGFLVTMDIEKASDLLDHNFLISILEKYGFGQNFILWIKILLNDQESRVINGCKTTKYFMLGRGAHQGDQISVFLFILGLEVLFLLKKTKPEIAGLTILDHYYLYSANADDTTFFLTDTISIKNMVDTFHLFSEFFGLKPNLSECEITGMRCVDLKNVTLKILGTHFSYNEKLKQERNFYTTSNEYSTSTENMENEKSYTTLEGKIVIFKTLAISKIVFQYLITPVPRHVVNELEKIQKAFLWKNSSPKIKHETIYNDYKGGGLKNIDILNKIISLQCSWIRRLYDNSFHEWKLIPLFLIKNSFGCSLKFHSNLVFKRNKIKFFPTFYQQIILY